MRSQEEVHTAIEVLRITGEKVQEALDEGQISEENAEEMNETVEATLGVLNWVLGTDTTHLPLTAPSPELLKYAEGVQLFKEKM